MTALAAAPTPADARRRPAGPGSAREKESARQKELLILTRVSKHYRVRTSANPFAAPALLKAVDDVSLSIRASETFALVGESGSGKSTLGRVALRLTEPTGGDVIFDGSEITGLSASAMRRLRPRMQVVFQDPLGSLNPRMRVADIVAEPLKVFAGLRGSSLNDRVAELLRSVGLDPSRGSRPRSLSGGQRQRVGIARAIALNPQLILADEAVSALDVSVQAQITNLLAELRDRLGLTYLFIGHGLPIVRQISHRVGVMYMGRWWRPGRPTRCSAGPATPTPARCWPRRRRPIRGVAAA